LRTADRKRLLKALLISIIFHIIIILGMNFFEWFSEDNITDEYAPLIVKIESSVNRKSNNQDKIAVPEEIIETSSIKAPEVQSQPLDPIGSKVEYSSAVSSTKTDFDPYADIGINESYSNQIAEPEPVEEGTVKIPYIPTGENKIELERPVDMERNTNTQSIRDSGVPTEDPAISVLSDSEILDLKNALNSDNIHNSSNSHSQTESDSNLYEYRDVPVEFDNPGEKRELITNPSPEIPDDLPPSFPPEITYRIRFSLNPDGFIKVLSITPSSLYPKVDANILKALRSWTFKGSSGSEDVAGTITLIFKGK